MQNSDCGPKPPIIDINDGSLIFPTSDNMGIDSDGDLHMRIVIICQWKWIPASCISASAGTIMMTMTSETGSRENGSPGSFSNCFNSLYCVRSASFSRLSSIPIFTIRSLRLLSYCA